MYQPAYEFLPTSQLIRPVLADWYTAGVFPGPPGSLLTVSLTALGGVGFVLVGFIREGTGPLSCYHVILVVPVNVLAFVYIGREGRPMWELLPFLKSISIVLSLYYYQYYRTVPVIILLFALFLLPLYNIRIVQVPS